MEKLTYRQAAEVLKKLEDTIPIDDLILNEINVWPFIKSSITNQILGFQFREKSTLAKKNIKQRIGDVIFAFNKLIQLRKIKQKTKKIKVDKIFTKENKENKIIYISHANHRSQLIDGKYWNPYPDSFVSTVNNRNNAAIIEFAEQNNRKEPPFEKIIYADDIVNRAKYRNQKKILVAYLKAIFFPNRKAKNNFPEKLLFKRLEELNISEYYNYQDLVYEFNYIQSLRIELRDFFKKTKPKHVVFGVFYAHEAFASVLACKDLSIKTIEVQHGLYNKIFYQLPVKNYELLPHYFFSWNTEQSNIVNSWAKKTSTHKAFSYGINSLSFWMKKKSAFNNGYGRNIQDIVKANTSLNFILFTFSDCIEDQLADLIILSKNEVFWFLRLHPRIKYQNLDVFIEKLKKTNCSNYDIENASKAPMYPLLEAVDFHMTSSSSVVMEALVLSIPSFVINDAGKILYYEDYANNPLVHFTQKNSEILEIIRKKTHNERNENEQINIVFENFLKKTEG